jgi:hypothetical protein
MDQERALNVEALKVKIEVQKKQVQEQQEVQLD